MRVESAEVLQWEGGPHPLTGVLNERGVWTQRRPQGMPWADWTCAETARNQQRPRGGDRAPAPAEGAALPTTPSPGRESAVLVCGVGSVGLCCEVPGRDCTEPTWSHRYVWGSVSHSDVSDSLQPRDCSPPGCSVRGILQARMLEWIAISSSRGSS